MGCGSTSVIITDDSETLELEFEVVGGTCESANTASVKSGWI